MQVSPLQGSARRVRRLQQGAFIGFSALLLAPLPARAQDGQAPGVVGAEGEDDTDFRERVLGTEEEAVPAPPPPSLPNVDESRAVAFEANGLEYDSTGDIVTATGDVLLRQGDQSVHADAVTWNRTTGQIVATGDIRFVDEDGNQLFTDRLELTEELKAGAMTNMLLAFRAGGRLAAAQGQRTQSGDIELQLAAYSACSVVTEEGCDKEPSWRVTAQRVFYDNETKEVRFRGAYLELFGHRVLPLPGLAIRSDGGASSGFLVPDFALTASNGAELTGSYYWRIAENRDLVASAYIYTEVAPMVSAQYRALTENGAYQVTGFLTYGTRVDLTGIVPDTEKSVRGYLFANGRFQLDRNWSVTGSVRYASDRTFLRRYDISRDDRLRSTVNLERIGSESYLSIAGWATQATLVPTPQGLVPIALPVIDYRRRIADPVLGGQFELQLNSLAITRTEGQDTQRAFARAQWQLRRLTAWGQELTVTALLRGDVYHSDENNLTITPSYRGMPGWETRGVAIGAVDLKWPFVGSLLGGTQVLTPRIQLVATPAIENLTVPNEDSRSIDLEDSNLFALNRFAGYDRVEDGARVTYGVDWAFERPGWRAKATIGQSYRLTDKPVLFPGGTGLVEQFSDFVGRTEVRFRDFVKFTHRYRIDKDSLAVRRNEIDATVGTDDTYVEMGYLRLDRDLDLTFEDLLDREEARFAGRYAFAKYWSVFGSAVVNLTNREEDPSFTADGFKPLRTRLGIAYEDDCLEFGFTWRRDYVQVADVEDGDSFRIYFALKNLGFR